MTVREAILKIVESKFKITNARVCVVKKVDEDDRSCTLETQDTQVELLTVRLQADTGNGILCIPKEGSLVVATEIARFEYGIIMFSELESIQFLDGSFGGLVKVSDLVSRLNAIEQKVNEIISTYNSHTHTETGATTAPTAATISGSVTETKVSDIENPLVKHGQV